MTEEMRLVDHPMVDGFTEENLKIYAGPDGAGGVPHLYQIREAATDKVLCEIVLQHGHPKEVGVNGIGNQSLLLILQDFLRKANAGEFPCRETSVGITKIEEALHWNKQRELDRKKRGVLQTYKK